MRTDKCFKTIPVLRVDSLERMRDLINLIGGKNDFYRTKGVFVKLYRCQLPTLILIFFGVFRYNGPHLHWIHLFSVGNPTHRHTSKEDSHMNVVYGAPCISWRGHFYYLTTIPHQVVRSCCIIESLQCPFRSRKVGDTKQTWQTAIMQLCR